MMKKELVFTNDQLASNIWKSKKYFCKTCKIEIINGHCCTKCHNEYKLKR